MNNINTKLQDAPMKALMRLHFFLQKASKRKMVNYNVMRRPKVNAFSQIRQLYPAV